MDRYAFKQSGSWVRARQFSGWSPICCSTPAPMWDNGVAPCGLLGHLRRGLQGQPRHWPLGQVWCGLLRQLYRGLTGQQPQHGRGLLGQLRRGLLGSASAWVDGGGSGVGRWGSSGVGCYGSSGVGYWGSSGGCRPVVDPARGGASLKGEVRVGGCGLSQGED